MILEPKSISFIRVKSFTNILKRFDSLSVCNLEPLLSPYVTIKNFHYVNINELLQKKFNHLINIVTAETRNIIVNIIILSSIILS